jgi:ABC-type multidrug transport system permease subunit
MLRSSRVIRAPMSSRRLLLFSIAVIATRAVALALTIAVVSLASMFGVFLAPHSIQPPPNTKSPS